MLSESCSLPVVTAPQTSARCAQSQPAGVADSPPEFLLAFGSRHAVARPPATSSPGRSTACRTAHSASPPRSPPSFASYGAPVPCAWRLSAPPAPPPWRLAPGPPCSLPSRTRVAAASAPGENPPPAPSPLARASWLPPACRAAPSYIHCACEPPLLPHYCLWSAHPASACCRRAACCSWRTPVLFSSSSRCSSCSSLSGSQSSSPC
mmetsp:Transcript_22467/g.38063  ORF Transcript_22467/g.38063 Transcript_22467/m.38063 type:complete len:207 (+) Transcript_22467:229-849(+)